MQTVTVDRQTHICVAYETRGKKTEERRKRLTKWETTQLPGKLKQGCALDRTGENF